MADTVAVVAVVAGAVVSEPWAILPATWAADTTDELPAPATWDSRVSSSLAPGNGAGIRVRTDAHIQKSKPLGPSAFVSRSITGRTALLKRPALGLASIGLVA
ncbi:hypothetical protein NUW58_g4356 [Xylaria curta]|uniref:Uncharacterized protein n=1 Tax=Xylaria curta TaxID=42375 RepID=A0ACC1P890_9PEZI|nr:hypothetical protein NUW58_g4356 [Xylaria curta]